MKNIKRIGLIALVLIVVPTVAFGQSEKDADNAGNLFKGASYRNPLIDRKAHAAGDILTVVISENSTSSYTAQTSLSKTDSNSVSPIGLPIIQSWFNALTTGASSSNSGSGSTSATGKLSAQMTVTVKQVLPNGNFVIEGTREIRVNKETQTFRLSGVVRPDDIQADNTIASAAISDAHIDVDGKGGVADRQRRGILTRILDWLF